MHKVEILSIILMFGCGASAAFCQSSVSGTTSGGRQVRAELVAPNIVKVSNAPAGSAFTAEQTVILPSGLSDEENYLNLAIDSNGAITISDTRTGLIFKDSGERITENGNQRMALYSSGRGSIYGGGERGHRLNLRGDSLVNYNRQNYGYTGNDPRISQMNITMPLIIGNDGYGIVFDDFAASHTITGDSIVYISESLEPVNYYYIGGAENLMDVSQKMTSLTGRQPLPPLWSLGYITSKYGYRNAEETLAVADTFKMRGYPLDGMVLDLYWFGREQDMGRLDWDLEAWPDPAGMMRQLKDRNINLITVSEPYVLRNGLGIENYNQLAADSMFVRDSEGNPHNVVIWVGEGGMFDVSNPATRQWLRNRYKMLTDLGVEGWWGDLGEPEVHPETGIHANGLNARQYHNHYGNDWSSIISELFASEYPDRRLMTLMRGGSTGLQRHGVFPWSTDVSRSWGGLEPQVRIMLNSGMSGLGYMSSDLGGFAVDPENPYIPELYVRWVEMGLFSPVFRTHAQQYAEPYLYPEYEPILLNIIKERYRWLPYNYALAYENNRYGLPLARPLNFNELGNADYDSISDEYMWGSDVLVAPVMNEGAVSRRIVFPAGTVWVDMNNPANTYQGGSVVEEFAAPIEIIPHFARGGALIPMAEYEMGSTADYRTDRYTVHYYPAYGAAGDAIIFIDNLQRPGTVESGEYVLLNIHSDGNSISTSVKEGNAAFGPENIELDIKIHNGTETTTKTITLNRNDNYQNIINI